MGAFGRRVGFERNSECVSLGGGGNAGNELVAIVPLGVGEGC